MVSASGSGGATDVGGLSVILPPLYEIFWSAVIFLLLWLVLGWALKIIYKKLDARSEEIERGLHLTENAKEEAALAERERRDLMREANKDARDVREKAHKDATRILSEARAQATEEASRIAQGADQQIASDRKAAELALRKDVGELATELAEKIIGEQLKDKDLSQRVTDRFMDELEASLEKTPTP